MKYSLGIFLVWLTAIQWVACEENSDSEENSSSEENTSSEGSSDSEENSHSEESSESELAVPWGSCGPPELSEAVPEAALAAANEGMSSGRFTDRGASLCEDQALGIAFRLGVLDKTKVDGLDTPDNFVAFSDSYYFTIECDGTPQDLLHVEFFQGEWQTVGSGGKIELVEALSSSDITHQEGCVRGLFDIHEPDYGFAILAGDENPYVFPLSFYGDDDYGEENSGKDVGEVYFTKQEFLEWLAVQDL